MAKTQVFILDEGTAINIVAVNGNDYVAINAAEAPASGYNTEVGEDVTFSDIENCEVTGTTIIHTEHQPSIDGDGAPYFKVIDGYANGQQQEFVGTRPPRRPRVA